MRATLGYKKDFLCVLTESEITNNRHGSALLKQWFPLHRAEEAEVRTLLGRLVTKADSDEGIYVDEDGAVFQLADKGRT
jgi:hypothetical protein